MVITKNRAYGLLALGIILAVLAVVIDPLRGYAVYLHWSQIAALVVGVVLALAGAYFAWIKKPGA